jgi:hypothetical protein
MSRDTNTTASQKKNETGAENGNLNCIPVSISSSELSECRCRAERIKQLGQELDRIGRAVILKKRFGEAA